MLTYEEACETARRHAAESPIDHPDYRIGFAEGRVLPEGWYFDYTIEPTRPMPEEEREHFGGAPGFIVPNSGESVRAVTWAEFNERGFGRAPLAK
jgi:hypothetical protein